MSTQTLTWTRPVPPMGYAFAHADLVEKRDFVDGWRPMLQHECPALDDKFEELLRDSGMAVRKSWLGQRGNAYKCWQPTNSDYTAHEDNYRGYMHFTKKPYPVPEPPEGRQWHLNEMWRGELLLGGYRPLMLGERFMAVDEFDSFSNGWRAIGAEAEEDSHPIEYYTTVMFRTKRPLYPPHSQVSEVQPQKRRRRTLTF